MGGDKAVLFLILDHSTSLYFPEFLGPGLYKFSRTWNYGQTSKDCENTQERNHAPSRGFVTSHLFVMKTAVTDLRKS